MAPQRRCAGTLLFLVAATVASAARDLDAANSLPAPAAGTKPDPAYHGGYGGGAIPAATTAAVEGTRTAAWRCRRWRARRRAPATARRWRAPSGASGPTAAPATATARAAAEAPAPSTAGPSAPPPADPSI
ncbi:hypothetical protein PVAP13_3KG569275 [Panicum virgatum]|uniref:Uncharacterized protein n=1 Tax=Panicum virgatum TaxID=38727 RepID=A0A8T0V8Y5_PANVG|nr:hypothetical protein PVAP13_3KG569275 [Panicum virgatum]